MSGPVNSVHDAIELGDLEALRNFLDDGVDVNLEDSDGLTLLHHAIDVELDSHVQSGEPLHVDLTAYLLARGADPKRCSHGGRGVSAAQRAFVDGHWLATALFSTWASRESSCPGDASPA